MCKTYIDDLVIVIRGKLDDHLLKIDTVLTRLLGAGLKVNAVKSSFSTHEIKYLGYILTREGNKPQPKKVQAILMLSPPNNVKELRHFLGIVQYYWDIWAKHSQMLAPLTDWWESAGKQRPPPNIRPRRNLGGGIQFINKHLTMSRLLSQKKYS
jgi:hypothetical protein